jgi:predicted nucleotidyltransferase
MRVHGVTIADYLVSVNRYIREVTSWAQSYSAIVALALVGSHARREANPDSDIDFILICDAMTNFIDDSSWARQFGEIENLIVEDWGVVTSLRVIYADGCEVEFGLAPCSWADIPVDEGTRKVMADGIMILVDKEGILKTLNDNIINTSL